MSMFLRSSNLLVPWETCSVVCYITKLSNYHYESSVMGLRDLQK